MAALKECKWSRNKAAQKLGVRPGLVRDFVAKQKAIGANIPNSPDVGLGNSHALRMEKGVTRNDLETARQLKHLKKELAKTQEQVLTDDIVRKEILGIADTKLALPDWLLKPGKSDKITGVPTLFASDWHWSEVVRPSEIGGVNQYNLPIAHRRAENMINIAVRLLKHYIRDAEYPGIVYALGGDMISGDIHEELKETNEIESIPAVLDIFGVLVKSISTLAAEFGKVFVPCVTGNHGRTSKKPRAKRRNHTNFDWLIYQLLSRHFVNDPRVTFLIPDGSDALYRVYGHRYLLTHGDQFRGGDGMIGMLGPVLRGDHKKRTRNSQVNQGYDTMIMGHWHQLTQLARVIVNGSLKGYDEYAAAGNFTFEPPAQALWITHPQHGITFSMPIYVDGPGDKKASSDWVSISKASI